MLEQLRRSSRSALIYFLFAIIIAVFIVSFGPQSVGGCEARGGSMSYAAKVGGQVVSTQDFRYGFMLAGGGQYPPQLARQRRLKETIMDKLIERELLADEALRLGFRVTSEEVEDLIAESKMVGLGYEQSLPFVQKDGKFDYDLFRRFVQFQLGMSPRNFIEEQRREVLALRMRQLVRSGVNVAVDEVKTDFVRRETQANVEYLRFPLQRYESDMELGAEEVAAYSGANEAKLKDLYGQRKFLYEKAPKERKLRQLLVKLDGGASGDAVEVARKKAEAAATRIRKGEPFAKVAKGVSDDARTKGRGGALGWRRQGATALGPAVDEKVWAAPDGELVGPLKGDTGWYVVVAEGTREGDLSFDQVRLELAEGELRQQKSKARAKADAEAALAKAKSAAGKSLKDVFPAPAEKPVEPVGDAPPQAEETGLFARRGAIVEGIGTSAELAKAIFELTEQAPFAGPVEVAGSYVVVKLKERKQPDMAEFEKKRLELVQLATAAKGEEVVDEWARRRCQEAKDAKKISVNRELLRYDGGPEGAVTYEPCSPPLRF